MPTFTGFTLKLPIITAKAAVASLGCRKRAAPYEAADR
jgi:hypothetical protein